MSARDRARTATSNGGQHATVNLRARDPSSSDVFCPELSFTATYEIDHGVRARIVSTYAMSTYLITANDDSITIRIINASTARLER